MQFLAENFNSENIDLHKYMIRYPNNVLIEIARLLQYESRKPNYVHFYEKKLTFSK
jgi:hypothetical protein